MKKEAPIKVVRIFTLIRLLSEYPPKTVDKLALMMEVSPKTVYKDVQLLESLGFETEKDDNNRYQLKNNHRSEYHLDEHEKKLILGAIKKAGVSNMDINSISQKLKSSVIPDVYRLSMVKQLNMIRVLVESVAQRIPVLLHDYQSTSSGSKIRDRKVLPLYFDENRLSLTAYDFDKKESRIFKVSRMKDIIITDTFDKTEDPVDLPLIDAFGLAGSMDVTVTLCMTWRASSLLEEEFPVLSQNIMPSGDADFPYTIQVKVCGYEGIGRFVLGLLSEIRITGNDGFKTYIDQKIKNQQLLS